MVFHGKRQVVSDEDNNDMTNDIEDTISFSSQLLLMNDKCKLDEFYMWNDHGEGIWVKDLPREQN